MMVALIMTTVIIESIKVVSPITVLCRMMKEKTMIHKECSGCIFKHRGALVMDDLEHCLECFNTDYEKPETLEDEERENDGDLSMRKKLFR